MIESIVMVQYADPHKGVYTYYREDDPVGKTALPKAPPNLPQNETPSQ